MVQVPAQTFLEHSSEEALAFVGGLNSDGSGGGADL